MWVGAVMAGTALAMRAAMAGPTLALQAATGAAGLALLAAEEMRRQSLRAGAEAVEALEDFVAESDPARRDGAALDVDEVIEGYVAGSSVRPPPPPLVAEMHRTETRLRLQCLMGPLPDGGAALAAALAGFPGVCRVVPRAMTGSLLIETAPGLTADLADRMARAGLIALSPFGLRHPGWVAARLSLQRADMAVRLRSGGRVGLGEVISGLPRRGRAARGQDRPQDEAGAKASQGEGPR